LEEKKMKLRTKTIITIALISILIFGVLQAITALVIDPSFSNLEIQESKHNINQALSTINYSLTILQGQLKDYSCWDDTFNYVQNKNQEYVENNFVESTFENLNLNLLVIVDNNRSLVYCQSFDLNNSVKVQTSEETRKILTSNENIWAFNSTEDITSGVMKFDNQPMFVATSPILTSLNQGPIMGGMLFGRYIDEKEISQLAEIMSLNFSINNISYLKLQKPDNQIVDSLLKNETTVIVKENSPYTVTGYTLINDIDSNPSFILQVTQDRTVNQQGVWVKNIFLVASIALAFCVGAGFLFLLEIEIVKPMMKLAATVEEIPLDPNVSSTKKRVGSSEELAVLSKAVRNSVNKRLEGMNEASRMVGHDLRNPLAGIRGATYVLKKNYGEYLGEKGNSMLKIIDDCVEYSDKIVRDLLDYSSEIKLDKIKTNPSRLINVSLSTLVMPANVQVINETSDEFSVLVDNGKIERVFSNLIKNACDAMPNGGQLKITSRKVQGQVEIGFSDSGTGMSKEILQKLWTPFFTTKPKGMGIGLGICKRIVEAHMGRVKVETTSGKGTLFAVFLPLENS
jgi:signal transduction histidine kinase